MLYRGTRFEPRVGVANWTGEIHKGELYEDWEQAEGQRCPPGKIPSHIAKYLCSHGILMDADVSPEPAASPDPSPRPTQKKLVMNEGT